MRRALIALLALATALDVRASCTARVDTARFTVQPDCTFEKPCVAGQPVTFRIQAETGCISPWVPCQDYAFDSCDTVTWDFGDGTHANSGHSPTVTHVFTTPGPFDVYGHIDNGRGQNQGGSGVVISYNPPGFVQFALDDYTTHEGAGEITIVLKRTGNVSLPVHMKLDAGAILKFKDEPETREHQITMAAGQTELPLTLLVPDDDVFDGERREFVYVYSNSGEAVMPAYQTIASTFVRIVDDEAGPHLSVGDDVTVTEGDSGHALISIPLTLSQPIAQDLPLFVTYFDGTATVGRDYETPDGEHGVIHDLTIPAGSTHANLTAYLLGDTETEPNETFHIVLERPTVAPPVTLDRGEVLVTIVDDDLYHFASDVKQSVAGVDDTLTIINGHPSAAPVEVALHSSAPAVVSVPTHVTLSGASAAFAMHPLRAGNARITGTASDGSTFDTLVVVAMPQDEPPVLPPPPSVNGRHRGVRH